MPGPQDTYVADKPGWPDGTIVCGRTAPATPAAARPATAAAAAARLEHLLLARTVESIRHHNMLSEVP